MRTATTPTTAYSTITLSMPQSDAAFARAIAKRMGWTIERKKKTAKPRLYDPETGEYLNDKTMKVIEDVRSGKEELYQFDSFEDFKSWCESL